VLRLMNVEQAKLVGSLAGAAAFGWIMRSVFS